MGIDKSDIQSVIHFDLPRSIENYVQEIGRAGRDGTLARCHMFLNNNDFYTLRRITLSDLLDSQSAYRLTNKLVAQAKTDLTRILYPDREIKVTGRKRKKSEFDADQANIYDEFTNETELQALYTNDERKSIRIAKLPEFENRPFYVALDVKELINTLDLKKEVLLTMLNQLESVGPYFVVNSIMPRSVGLRFHKASMEELAEGGEKFFQAVARLEPKAHLGVHRVSLIDLAHELDVKPY